MAIRSILKYPQEEATLRKISKPVEVFDEKLAELLVDMNDTMIRAKGAGLSAVQVGILKRVCIINTGERLVELINPVITKQSGVNKIKDEGCLSLPNEWCQVKRPNVVMVDFFDRFGNKKTETFVGYEAKAVCHECDHLDGILFIDRVDAKLLKGRN